MSEPTTSQTVYCPHCGHEAKLSLVKTAIWQGDRVFLVEDIPARLCEECLEQFYDDETSDILRRLAEDGFPSVKATREILVPIFSLGGTVSTAA